MKFCSKCFVINLAIFLSMGSQLSLGQGEALTSSSTKSSTTSGASCTPESDFDKCTHVCINCKLQATGEYRCPADKGGHCVKYPNDCNCPPCNICNEECKNGKCEKTTGKFQCGGNDGSCVTDPANCGCPKACNWCEQECKAGACVDHGRNELCTEPPAAGTCVPKGKGCGTCFGCDPCTEYCWNNQGSMGCIPSGFKRCFDNSCVPLDHLCLPKPKV